MASKTPPKIGSGTSGFTMKSSGTSSSKPKAKTKYPATVSSRAASVARNTQAAPNPATGVNMPSGMSNRELYAYHPAADSTNYIQQYKDLYGVEPAQTPGENLNPTGLGFGGGGGGGGRGGRGGGGGGSAIDQARVRQIADTAFTVNQAPYWQQVAAIQQQRDAANAYNPNMQGITDAFNTQNAALDQQRAAAQQQRMAAIQAMQQQLQGTQATAMQGALRDLQAQGADVSGYLNAGNQMASARTGQLSNYGAYEQMLAAAAAERMAGAGSAANLMRTGAEANLANNRGTLLNALGQQEFGVRNQLAQAQIAQDQARQEFLLKYGMA